MKRSKQAPKTGNLGEDRGCCCKRSACRKKYCECFRMNTCCTKACKCVDCRNTPGPFILSLGLERVTQELSPNQAPAYEAPKSKPTPSITIKTKEAKQKQPKSQKETEAATTQISTTNNNETAINFAVKEQPIFLNFINDDVVEASVECMLAQARECSDNGLTDMQTQKMILDEFDRCLVGILASMEITEDAKENIFM